VKWFRWLLYPAGVLLGLLIVGAATAGFAALIAYDNLPSLDSLTEYRPKVPLRIYTQDGALIGEFGEERRTVVKLSQVPPLLKEAILAAEDARFYQHTGVDLVGVARAAVANLTTGSKRQGASTITMQVARNMFLTPERTFSRKLHEILLAFKIEATLTKDQILELYINQIYLGQRAYGFASAAQTYFSKPIGDLTLGEAAMLAGLPKAPSSYNPVVNPKRARERQLYVLSRMLEYGQITPTQYAQARDTKLVVHQEASESTEHAEYVAEMVRQAMAERYPDDTYTRGYRVYTTLTRDDQETAYKAVRRGLIDFDRRHGYRGPERYVEVPPDATEEQLDELLSDVPDSDDLLAGIVLSASPKQVRVYRRGGDTLTIQGEGLRLVQRALESSAGPNMRLVRGAIVRIAADERNAWSIVQMPEAEVAFVSMNPADGGVRALVGGFDFQRNQYNHVTQAWRQPGSAFKPFIYSAALEKGFTPSTIIDDAPIVIDASLTGGQAWEPKNYDNTFEGPMRMRTALAKSKNLVSIRILQTITPQYAQDYITRFGFDADHHPPYLTMALGAGTVTPLQMVRAYSAFANGGYRVDPYLISRVVDDNGNPVALARPVVAGRDAKQILDERNAFLMDSMMKDVVRFGTGARAATLGRDDLAGKTGTTNDFDDAWFCGYHPSLVSVVWVGYDQPRKLGETGAAAALPIWMSYMGRMLKGVPPVDRPVPDGIITVRIDAATGIARPDGDTTDYFYRENGPPGPPGSLPPQASDAALAGRPVAVETDKVLQGRGPGE
jgi:penicillin-binding protein 1A